METQVRKNKIPIKLIILISVVVFLISSILGVVRYFQTPELEGKWVSTKTGKVVEFTKSGVVKVNRKKEGTYIVTASNMMKYTTGGYTFDMEYEIVKRNLLWGVSGEEKEKFKRR